MRVPRTLQRRLVERAAHEGCSLNQLVTARNSLVLVQQVDHAAAGVSMAAATALPAGPQPVTEAC